MQAIVLAGGESNIGGEELPEAFLPIGGKYMLDRLVEVLLACPFSRIVVVGPPAVAGRYSDRRVSFAPAGVNPATSLLAGLERVDEEEEVFIVTADLPLLRRETVLAFLQEAGKGYDLIYPVVPRETIEKEFPGGRRTYVRLREGVFTGGNAVIARPRMLKALAGELEEIISLRKRPWRLARRLGVSFLFRLALGRLSIADVERKVEEMFHMRGKGLIFPYADMGFDVDKADDLEKVTLWLQKRRRGKEGEYNFH